MDRKYIHGRDGRVIAILDIYPDGTIHICNGKGEYRGQISGRHLIDKHGSLVGFTFDDDSTEELLAAIGLLLSDED